MELIICVYFIYLFPLNYGIQPQNCFDWTMPFGRTCQCAIRQRCIYWYDYGRSFVLSPAFHRFYQHHVIRAWKNTAKAGGKLNRQRFLPALLVIKRINAGRNETAKITCDTSLQIFIACIKPKACQVKQFCIGIIG